MPMYTLLRLVFAAFLLYVAWPFIPLVSTRIAQIFWLAWLAFFILVVGGNLATFLRMASPPVMEQKSEAKERELSR